MRVEIPKKVISKFRKFARLSYPNECCGFFLGVELKSAYIIESIYIPLDQEKYASPDGINICADWWDDAEEEAAKTKVGILGFIHSHPDYRDVSGSEQDFSLTKYVKLWLPEVVEPIMGVVGVYETNPKTHRLMTKVGIWPMFDQHKIVTK